MGITIRSILLCSFLLFGAPAQSGAPSQIIQLYVCEFNNDEASEEDILELAAAWLKAAKETEGGANMELVIRFPVAAGLGAQGDFTWLISTPTFAEWGQFTDAYENSPVAKVDDELFDNLADCGQSSIWEGFAMD